MHSFTPFLRPFVSSAITVPAFCVLYTICTSTTSALRELFLYLPSARFFPSTIHSFSPHFRSTFLRFKTIVYFEMCVCFFCAVQSHRWLMPMPRRTSWSKRRFATIFILWKVKKKTRKHARNNKVESLALTLKPSHTHTHRGRERTGAFHKELNVFFSPIHTLTKSFAALQQLPHHPLGSRVVCANKIDFIYKTYQFDLNYVCKISCELIAVCAYVPWMCECMLWRHEPTLHYLFVVWHFSRCLHFDLST